MSRQHRQEVKPASGLLGFWSSLLLCSILCAGHATAETTPSQPQAAQGPSQAQPQERFLQHFISQSLGKEPPPAGAVTAPAGASTAVPAAPAPPAASGRQPAPPQVDLTTTTLKMVFALGGMLGVLALLGYGIRRYLQAQSPVGKRHALLRIIARVNVTPKASIALVEVPGKMLLIGITGTTLTALGEVAPPAVVSPPAAADTEALPSLPPVSFATALDESSESLVAAPRNSEAFLRVSEAIQQKISRLKQL